MPTAAERSRSGAVRRREQSGRAAFGPVIRRRDVGDAAPCAVGGALHRDHLAGDQRMALERAADEAGRARIDRRVAARGGREQAQLVDVEGGQPFGEDLGFEGTLARRDLGEAGGCLGADVVVLIGRNRDGRENRDDRDDDHQLDQGETTLCAHCRPSWTRWTCGGVRGGCGVRSPGWSGRGGGGRRGEPLRPVTLTTRYQVQPVGRYFASRLGTVQVYWPVDVRVRVTTLPMTCGLPASVHLIVPVAEPATAIALQRVVVAARPMLACVLNVVEPRLIFSSN